MNMTDLVKNAGRGSMSASRELYQMFHKAMYKICIRMTGNKKDAEDLLQDSFLIAFNNLSDLQDPERFGGWLKKIVLNECIKFCKKRVSRIDLDNSHLCYIDEADYSWWLDVQIEELHEYIKKLPNGCRLVFNLFVNEDYSHKRIAETLQISEGTSKSQYFRAKALLKQSINAKYLKNGQV